MGQRIRVLVVDDSAFMRKAIRNMLESDPEIHVVGTARDGMEGVEQVRALNPDLVTLDVEMPRMDGLEALRRIMQEHPVPVLMVSSLTEEGARATLEALDLGAVDYIPKNLANLSVNIVKIRDDLLRKVKTIARTRHAILRRLHDSRPSGGRPPSGGDGRVPRSQPVGAEPRVPGAGIRGAQRVRVVAIGASTGGPKALQEILPALPKEFPVGILVVQHMPKAFTGPFAQRLDQMSQIRVKEAEPRDRVEPGTALIAPGGVHLKAHRVKTTEVEVVLSEQPSEMLHKPSVDVMMHSVAEAFGGNSLGVILTGMGADGKEGVAAIKRAGGKVLAQDEASCVVYGMPKAVVDAGLADKVVSLEELPGEIVNMV